MTVSIKKLAGITILVFALLLLSLDYFIIDAFNIETNYFIALVSLLAFDIYRRLNLNHKLIAILVSLGIVVTCIYQFGIIVLLAWGYGFLGSKWTVTWFLAIFANSALLVIALEEIFRNTKQQMR